MEARQVQDIIRSFFGKHFSKETQLRFRYWFCSADARDEKEVAVREIWEQTSALITERTWEELSDMQERIAREQFKAVHRPLFSRWGKYAAAVALIVATSVVTLLVSRLSVQVASPKLVEFYVPYGDCRQVTLADGSTVWVNAGSLLIYPSEFTADSRTVYLSGEARFQVAKNLDRPFIVGTNRLDIQALGTVFSNVNAENKSVETVLVRGSVSLHTLNGKKILEMNPGERVAYSWDENTCFTDHVDVNVCATWRFNQLVFENTTLREIANQLSIKYNVNVNIESSRLAQRRFRCVVNEDERLPDVLEQLCYLAPITYRIESSEIYISEKQTKK